MSVWACVRSVTGCGFVPGSIPSFCPATATPSRSQPVEASGSSQLQPSDQNEESGRSVIWGTHAQPYVSACGMVSPCTNEPPPVQTSSGRSLFLELIYSLKCSHQRHQQELQPSVSGLKRMSSPPSSICFLRLFAPAANSSQNEEKSRFCSDRVFK